MWGSLGEIMSQYLKKGAEIAIEGRLMYRTYDDSEGKTRYITEVVASDLLMLEMLGGNARSGENDSSQSSASSALPSDEMSSPADLDDEVPF